MPVIEIKGFKVYYERKENDRCKSYVAVFTGKCPYCGNWVTSDAENTGYGIIYYAVCENCKILFVWNTRSAWENNTICE